MTSPNPYLIETTSVAVDASIGRSCRVVSGSRKILALQNEISQLRLRTGQQEDPTTDLDWFTKMTLARSCNPWVVLLSERHRPVAAMLLAEKRIFGLPSGYMKAEGADQGFLICQPELRSAYLPLLLRGLFDKSSALIAQVMQRADAETALSAPVNMQGLLVEWKPGMYHYRLQLKESFDKTLAAYGPHTRRNLRYYLRKARAEGCRFDGELTKNQRIDAVMALRGHATHPVSVSSAQMQEAAMQSTPGSFGMGVQGADGSWLSYLTGWRRGNETFVYWQMNQATDNSSSMGTAMRSFLMEKEIARGVKEIVFVGGSSAVFKRCCEVDPSVHLIVRRKSARGWMLSRLLERTVVPGHPLRRDGEAA